MFDDLDTMNRLTGKPILIGEFSYRAADAGLPNTLPPFFPTFATQAERAHAAGTYLRRVLARPYVVGAHWFQYMDQPATGRFDGENQNFGLVQIIDDPWPALTERFQQVLADAAPRRLLFPGGGARTDCVLEWASTAPASTAGRRRPPARFACRDGDPACDTDATIGRCTVDVQPCAAVADGRLPRCAPRSPATVRVAAPSAQKDAALRDALAASLGTVEYAADAAAGGCGPAVAVRLTLGSRARVQRVLRTVASADDGLDHEAVRVSCERGP
jgi:hypothetical protein